VKDYYATPPSLGQRLRCCLRFLLFLGHDFEIQFTRERPLPPYHPDAPRVGEMALVCRLCGRVENRRDYHLLPEISYGSSPSMGRRLEHRQVDRLPIAPDGQEPLCGATPPLDMGIPAGITCRKFAWHVLSSDRSMLVHDGSRPVRGGQQSYMWDDRKEATS